MNNLITQLREAAKRATPGPYGFLIGPTWITALEKILPENPRFERYEDAVFWSHCSPENILALLAALKDARELAEGCTNACIFDYPGEKEFVTSGICTCRDKARAFLAKYFPKGD